MYKGIMSIPLFHEGFLSPAVHLIPRSTLLMTGKVELLHLFTSLQNITILSTVIVYTSVKCPHNIPLWFSQKQVVDIAPLCCKPSI